MAHDTAITIDSLIEEILSSGKVNTAEDKTIELNSNIDREEGVFIESIIREYGVSRSLEVGCAYGLSSLYICKALALQQNPVHYIIDPHQTRDWHGVGINNLKRCGIEFFEFIENFSELALPELLSQGVTVDFCFIDGWHSFDQTLLDFFYCERLIPVGGIIAIDDCHLPSVKKVVRYVTSNLANFEIVGSISRPVTRNRAIINRAKNIFNTFTKIFGKRIQRELLSSEIYQADHTLHLNSSLIAFKKTAPDNRTWYDFEQF